MIYNTLVKEVRNVRLTSSPLIFKDTLSLDEIDFELGPDGIKELITDFMHKFKKTYEGQLVEILQDPDFEDVRDILVVDEVKDLDTEIRLLKEEVKELKSDLMNERNMVRVYEDVRD